MSDEWIINTPVSQKWPVYTRGNVGEVFPEAVTPLGWSLAGLKAEEAWRDSYRDLGVCNAADFEGEGGFAILGIFNGYCYLNASILRMIAVRAPGGSVEQLDTLLFGEGATPPYVPQKGHKSLWTTIRFTLSAIKMMGGSLGNLADEARAIADKHVALLPDLTEASDQELLDYLFEMAEAHKQIFYRHITVSFGTTVVAGPIGELCAKAGDINQQVAIISGIVGDDLESAKPCHAMWDLGRIVRETPELTALFDQGHDGLLERLQASPDAAEFNAKFQTFLADYGFRGPNEWELISDTWETRPSLVLTAVDSMRKAEDARRPSTVAAAARQAGQAALAEVCGKLSPREAKKLKKLLRVMALYQRGRELAKTQNIRAINAGRRAFFELARRAAARGGPEDLRKAATIEWRSFADFIANPASFSDMIEERWNQLQVFQGLEPAFIIDGVGPETADLPARGAAVALAAVGDELSGIGGSPGIVRGRARVVLHPSDPRGLEPGDILVAPITDPAWTPLFVPAAGVVVEVGAIISHAVIVARELGIPCACSVANATGAIPDGAMLELDGTQGVVRILEA